MAKPPKDQDQLPKEEADRRQDELALRILRTPPQPRKEKGEDKPSGKKRDRPKQR